ncbi:relaxase MobL [Allofournierella massiliensis]|uniref:relaxase MobL n=1 Tax=Allofournierella massiliensis TaxID=1650663 RepID=UPI00356B3BDF
MSDWPKRYCRSFPHQLGKFRHIVNRLVGNFKRRPQLCDNPVIEKQMRQLVQALETTTGKKQYGYLKKPLKALVDAIVDELARQPEVAKCYETWNQIRDELNECYGSRTPREHLPLSQQKEFRRIKNDIIREAENIRLGLLTFEDEKMQDEPETAHEEQRSNSVYEQARRYRAAKAILRDVYALDEEHAEAVRVLEQLWAEGYTVAAHQIGKFYRDDLSTMRDHEKAEQWFRLSAEAGNDFSEYALGKLLLSQKRTAEAMRWLDRAAGHGNQFAQYCLGKLYLTGESVTKNVAKALEYGPLDGAGPPKWCRQTHEPA